MKDYHGLYLKSDVSLLADVIEKFRNRYQENYVLHCSHYLSALGLSWDAILNMTTKAGLDLIPEIDMYLFFEKGIRTGVFPFLKRYIKIKIKTCVVI